MRAEFKVNLKRTKALYVKRDRNKIHREPVLRQYLVLAYQVKKTIESQRGQTLKEIAGWIGYTPARMSQIMNYLFLSPEIQEEILLSNNKNLYRVPEHKVRKVMKETDWHKQKEMWSRLISSI